MVRSSRLYQVLQAPLAEKQQQTLGPGVTTLMPCVSDILLMA